MNTLKDQLADNLQNIIPQMENESTRQGHHYLGVEHLFMALTHLENGVIANALKAQGLSPRFIRHSVRAAAGRGDNIRHWPGFRHTPRLMRILAQAKQINRGQRLGERSLLLAILQERESVPIRVLIDLGVDLERLEAQIAGWQESIATVYPTLPISGAKLDPAYVRVLSQMFSDYRSLKVIRIFQGFSGATVLLVRPMRTDGRAAADVVVKLHRGRAIQYEKLRYDSYVKSTLPPITARITDPPVVLTNPDVGGLKYTFVGQQGTEYTSNLFEYVQQHGPDHLGEIIRKRLYETFGWGWWNQRQPYQFTVWQEYEHVLPEALVIELLPDQSEARGRHLHPQGRWSREQQFDIGELVTLENFTIYRAYPERQQLKLVAGARPVAEDRANKVTVKGATSAALSNQGDRLEQLVGRVVDTRHNILKAEIGALFPDLDLDQPFLQPLPEGPEIRNPLLAYQGLLHLPIEGTLSTIHGDLHLGNILVDPDARVWLIDFTWSRDGHTLFDWVVLEVSLLADIVAPQIEQQMIHVVQAIDALNQGQALPALEDQALSKTLHALQTLREIVRQCLHKSNEWNEYYSGFVMCALRALTWDTVSKTGKQLLFIACGLAINRLAEFIASYQDLQELTIPFSNELFDTSTGDTDKP